MLHEGVPRLVRGERLLRWSPPATASRWPRPRVGRAGRSITPPSLLALLAPAGSPVVPLLHPSSPSNGSGGAPAGAWASSVRFDLLQLALVSSVTAG